MSSHLGYLGYLGYYSPSGCYPFGHIENYIKKYISRYRRVEVYEIIIQDEYYDVISKLVYKTHNDNSKCHSALDYKMNCRRNDNSNIDRHFILCNRKTFSIIHCDRYGVVLLVEI